MAEPYFTRRRRISLKKAHICLLTNVCFFLAGVERIELSRRESKSRVLPLDYTPIGTIDIIA